LQPCARDAVSSLKTGSGGSYEDPAILSFLRSRRILIIPTVANIVDGIWDGALVERIISDAGLRAFNIASLVQLAVTNGYDGIDLDYENLSASYRDAYTAFVNELAVALHAHGKLLTVNVYAKTAEPGTWDGPQSQDWWAIGQAADQVRTMVYEYHWATSGPGPISPLGWVDDVLAFARSTIPAHKIIQGVPLYGYDWVGQAGIDLVWQQTIALANQHGVTINWDVPSASPWFEYVSGTKQHTVWFENAASTDAKLQVMTAYDIGGVVLWRLGGEDPGTWPVLRAHLDLGSSAPDVVPPGVTIVSPADGAWLQKKQKIEALASDDKGVARVEFYINGVLVASDTTAPYVIYWNTRRAAAANVIQAVAYDTSGNRTVAQVTAYAR
jgi:spore germination protein YaaH